MEYTITTHHYECEKPLGGVYNEDHLYSGANYIKADHDSRTGKVSVWIGCVSHGEHQCADFTELEQKLSHSYGSVRLTGMTLYKHYEHSLKIK